MAALSFSELCGTVSPHGTTSVHNINSVDGTRADIIKHMADVNYANGTNGTGETSVMAAVRVNDANGTNGAGVTYGRADVITAAEVVRSHPTTSCEGSKSGAIGENIEGKRTSVWDRLSYSSGSNGNQDQKRSFAAIVGSVPKPELEFFPLKNDSKKRVQIPKELTKGMVKVFNSVLIGYFLGPRIPFPVVLRAAHVAWGKFGFKDAMVNEHGFFFFRFNNEGGSTQVVESSPLMIKGVPLFLYPWDPSKGLCKPEHTSCPLWIKFYNIPLVAFNREGISRIASAVGVPLRMDACTASTCDKAWGRTNFAKVLVNVWATGELTKEVEVAIPHLTDDGEEIVKVVLEYDWTPTQCSVCKVFGHRDSVCAKVIVSKDQGKPIQKQDVEGSQLPQRKQWKPKLTESKENKGMAESSNDKIGNRGTTGDTLVGVGTVTRILDPNGTSQVHETDGADKGGKKSSQNKLQPQEIIGTDEISNEGSSTPDLDEEPPKVMTDIHDGYIREIQVEEARWAFQNSNKKGSGNSGTNTRQMKEDNPLKNTTGGVDQGKVNQVDNSNRNISKPLKSILKNPSNRFSALINTVINFDEEPVGKQYSEGRKENVLPNQMEKKDGRQGKDGTSLLPKR